MWDNWWEKLQVSLGSNALEKTVLLECLRPLSNPLGLAQQGEGVAQAPSVASLLSTTLAPFWNKEMQNFIGKEVKGGLVALLFGSGPGYLSLITKVSILKVA